MPFGRNRFGTARRTFFCSARVRFAIFRKLIDRAKRYGQLCSRYSNMSDGLRSKTIQALGWSFFESFILQGGRFIIGIVLARLLLPEQFGLIGMLALFVALAQSFLESGFGAALIQKQDPTPADVSSIFYFNIAVGGAGAALLCIAAPAIAEFFGQPILTPLTRALSLTVVINSFGLVQNTLLIRAINFKTLTKISLASGILSGVIAVVFAMKGFGVWSLAVQQISGDFLRVLLLWRLNPWRPARVFRFQSLREMFGFGSRLLASGLLNRIFVHFYALVIGKLFSPADLGFFTRAQTLQDLPSSTLSEVVGRVAFPVLSAIQDDRARVKRGIRKALVVLVFLNFPMMIGLAVIAHPLILLLFTEKWLPCVPYLQILCVAGLLYPLHVVNLSLLQALGRSDLFLRLEIIKKVLIVINIVLTWRWGLTAILYGIAVSSFISCYLNSSYSGILVGYPVREQVWDVGPYLIASVLMGAAVYGIARMPFHSLLGRLTAEIFLGVFVYLGLCRLFRLPALLEAWEAGWRRARAFSFRGPGFQGVE